MSWGSTGFTVFKNNGDETKIEAARKVIQTFLENEAYSQEVCVQTGNSTVLKDLDVDYGDEVLNEQAKTCGSQYGGICGFFHRCSGTLVVRFQRNILCTAPVLFYRR